MRFEGNSGSRVDIEAVGVGGVIVSVTQVVSQGLNSEACAAVVSMAVLDANHAEALASGILAACKELHARAVSL